MARKSQFLRKLELYGVQNLKTDDPKKVMLILHSIRKLSTQQIGDMFGVTAEAVRYWLDEFGMSKSTPNFPEKVLTLKNPRTGSAYRSLREFFIANVDKSFREIAGETGFSGPTVSRYYEQFVTAEKAAKGVF